MIDELYTEIEKHSQGLDKATVKSVYNALHRNDIYTLEELKATPIETISQFRCVGKVRLSVIRRIKGISEPEKPHPSKSQWTLPKAYSSFYSKYKDLQEKNRNAGRARIGNYSFYDCEDCYIGHYYGWNDILSFTKHSFEVTRLDQIPEDEFEEADDFACKLVDLYFENVYKKRGKENGT